MFIFIHSISASPTDFLKEISVVLEQEYFPLLYGITWPKKQLPQKITKVWTRRNGGKWIAGDWHNQPNSCARMVLRSFRIKLQTADRNTCLQEQREGWDSHQRQWSRINGACRFAGFCLFVCFHTLITSNNVKAALCILCSFLLICTEQLCWLFSWQLNKSMRNKL